LGATVAPAIFTLLVLPKLIGTTAFGLFAAGTLLVTRLAIVPDAIATAFYPLIAKSTGGSFHIMRRRILCGLIVSFLLCAAIAAGVFLASGVIARILFPRTPDECQQVIAITMWALPLMGIEMMMGFTLNALGRESAQARLAIIGALVSLSLCAVMIARWQAVGACWFMLVRPAVQIALLLPQMIRTLRWEGAGSNTPIGNQASRPDRGPLAAVGSSTPTQAEACGL
jgi:O-antigen/teichoic acid export membrane protein